MLNLKIHSKITFKPELVYPVILVEEPIYPLILMEEPIYPVVLVKEPIYPVILLKELIYPVINKVIPINLNPHFCVPQSSQS